MDCPVCGGATTVKDSRGDCEAVYRRRRCLDCNHEFYTAEYEHPDAGPLLRALYSAYQAERSKRRREKAKCLKKQ